MPRARPGAGALDFARGCAARAAPRPAIMRMYPCHSVSVAPGPELHSWERPVDESSSHTRRVSPCASCQNAEDESAADARKVKTATAKAAKAKAEKETARALASVAKPALPAMTVTQAIERLRAALTAGDDQAFAALFKMTDEFTSLAVEGQPADVVIA